MFNYDFEGDHQNGVGDGEESQVPRQRRHRADREQANLGQQRNNPHNFKNQT